MNTTSRDAVLDELREELPEAQIARVGLTREGELTVLEVYTARPGIVIGRRGATVAALKEKLETRLGPLKLLIIELRKPELEPLLLADNVLQSLGAGMALERIFENLWRRVSKAGGTHLRVELSGRLEGLREEGSSASGVLRHAQTQQGELRCTLQLSVPQT